MDAATNPFQIGVGFNDQMKCWELQVQIGGIKSEKQAKQFADLLADWLKGDSPRAWSQRVS